MDIFPSHILVAAIGIVHLVVVAATRLLSVLSSWMSRMTTDRQTNVLAGIEQLLPDILSAIARPYLIVFILSVFSRLSA